MTKMNQWIKAVAGLIVIGTLQACSKPADTDRMPTYDVVITSAVDGNKITAIKAVREVTGLGLKDAKDLVEGTPSIVKHAVSKTEAESVAAKLRASSLMVEIKQK
jgi:large subunit ribosomal protein L7/L12